MFARLIKVAGLIAVAAALAPSPAAAGTTVSYTPADPELCAMILKVRPERALDPIGCRYKITETTRAVRVLAHEAGARAAAAWRFTSVQTGVQSPFGVWGVRVNSEVRSNNVTVQLLWITCDRWGFGFTVTVDWCGAWNGVAFGRNYIDVGANITVSALYKGFPIAVSHGCRRYAYTDGRVGATRFW
jgi:hypothetical protein